MKCNRLEFQLSHEYCVTVKKYKEMVIYTTIIKLIFFFKLLIAAVVMYMLIHIALLVLILFEIQVGEFELYVFIT